MTAQLKRNKEETRNRTTSKIMQSISTTYSRDSGVAKSVERALGKLTEVELGQLQIMIATAITDANERR